MALLNVNKLSVHFGDEGTPFRAVDRISYSVNQGEVVGIVGESGSGKSVSSLAIMGLIDYPGRVMAENLEFNGQDLKRISEKQRRQLVGAEVAMIFQDPMTSLNPVISVGDQIAEAIRIHNPHLSKEEVEQRVENTLQMVGILPTRKVEYPHQFSGGMKQRVVIAMALACNPMLLIADEPTTALDVTIQAQVLMMIKDLRDRLGTSMLMITHDLGIVAKICDDVGVMYAGEIVEYGTVQDIFEGENHHPYTEGLFGSIPDLRSKSRRLNAIPGLMPDPTNLPKGCVFAERCKYATDLCRREHPSVAVSGTHQLCCHRFNPDGSRKEDMNG